MLSRRRSLRGWRRCSATCSTTLQVHGPRRADHVDGASAKGSDVGDRVEDTGIGIPPDKLDSDLRDVHRRSISSLERAQGGLGIGLTLVKRLVRDARRTSRRRARARAREASSSCGCRSTTRAAAEAAGRAAQAARRRRRPPHSRRRRQHGRGDLARDAARARGQRDVRGARRPRRVEAAEKSPPRRGAARHRACRK